VKVEVANDILRTIIAEVVTESAKPAPPAPRIFKIEPEEGTWIQVKDNETNRTASEENREQMGIFKDIVRPRTEYPDVLELVDPVQIVLAQGIHQYPQAPNHRFNHTQAAVFIESCKGMGDRLVPSLSRTTADLFALSNPGTTVMRVVHNLAPINSKIVPYV
jgi:hypothetical protein